MNVAMTACLFPMFGRLLLEKGAQVEGGVDAEEDICTETPLQLAAAAGKVDIVELLLSFGASPFLSTLKVDAMSFGSAAQKGCYCALSTAASHGQRKVLHKLVTHPSTLTSQNSGKEVLSLEEILAEGVANGHNGSATSGSDSHNGRHFEMAGGGSAKKQQQQNKSGGGGGPGLLYSRFTKSNVKRLQEAMYHSTECGNIDITLDLRNFGVPWSLHSWIRTLITAHQAGLTAVADELLQDFSKDWTEDNSAYFTDECLPVLVSIFKSNKSEGTTLLLADVLSACYGKDPIDSIGRVLNEYLSY
jgi:ankyrin repeat/BTB/POZ domain-containing protein 2